MNVFDFEADALDGAPVDLARWRGHPLLIVNTASECGFTPQYAGLEQVYRKYQDRGLVVLGFPCNQFGGQEPGGEMQIDAFCTEKYGVTFPMFSKINVNGDHAHPLYKHLKAEAPGVLGTQGIKWNFTKFLVDRSGKVYKRYAPQTKLDEIAGDIELLLA